ncbi:histidine kinase 5 [Phtheirospermum japonicum]|uniref:histidine kinase n=1 Tax=Phtheirospermum japonicum TaxID=374723 RepID=A0A830DEE6_9LAMI|nr:histidine kinase 5 [Phtheirospermum japonicum]
MGGSRTSTAREERDHIRNQAVRFENILNLCGARFQQDRRDDRCRNREKMAKLREEMAVQKAKETELNKTIHITEESMIAKQMLATMSHEIRSPLSGVMSMAEILSTTNLDKEQTQLLKVMLSSGDLVLELINNILDLSKVESAIACEKVFIALSELKCLALSMWKFISQTKTFDLQGYKNASASATLAANWPPIVQIVRLISRDHMNKRWRSALLWRAFFTTAIVAIVLRALVDVCLRGKC